MIKHQYGAISQIHLDYIQKPSHRSGLITFERGWISYDFNTMELKVQSNDAVRVIYSDPSYDLNNAYIDQMKMFINYVEEGRLKHSYDIFSGIESLKVIDAFFKSSKNYIRVKIPHNERFSF